MPKFAVLDDSLVVNVIIADNELIAEQVTQKTCVEYTDENPAYIGGEYNAGIFIQPKPYPSWILRNNKWEAPVAIPSLPVDADGPFYTWNEDTVSWVLVSD